MDGLDSDYGDEMDRLRMSLPDFDLNGFTNKDTVPLKAQHVLASALFSGIIQNLEVNFNISPRQKAVLECLQAPHAQDFLRVVPIDGLGQHMSALEYRAILKYRLMIPLFPTDAPCPVCHKVYLDSFGEHAVHCKELSEMLCVMFLNGQTFLLKRTKGGPRKLFNKSARGRSTLWPADILVFGWEGGKHSCVDLTGVSPLVGLSDTGFVASHAALKAESGKVAKHEKACLENQHVFTSVAFDTFEVLVPKAVNFLNRVQRVMYSNITAPMHRKIVFSRIGFTI
ncbi:hypothetical protein R6Q59_019514 [Mikania micrantha]